MKAYKKTILFYYYYLFLIVLTKFGNNSYRDTPSYISNLEVKPVYANNTH